MKVNIPSPYQAKWVLKHDGSENSNQTLTVFKPYPNLYGVYSLLHRLWQKDIHNRASSLLTYSLSPPRARSFHLKPDAPLPFPPFLLQTCQETALPCAPDASCALASVTATQRDTDFFVPQGVFDAHQKPC